MLEVKKCKSCRADIIWMRHPVTNKWNCINAESVDELDVEFNTDEEPIYQLKMGHKSHFATCPEAKKFRGAGKKQ